MSSGELQFSGEERFAVPPERVYAAITDLDSLSKNIPDAVSTERVGPTTLACVVRPGFSFLRGTLKLVIELGESDPPRAAGMRIAASGIGQSMKAISRSELIADGDGTLVRWTAEVLERKGLVAAVSKSLIQAAADKVIRDAWRQLHEQLGA